MMLKKIAVLPLLLLVAIGSLAQKPQFGIVAGPQLSTALYKVQGEKQSTSSRTGFMLGATAKVPFDTRLYFAPAIFYSLKGYEVKLGLPSFPPNEEAVDNATRLHTLELAFLLQYDFSNRPGHFFLRAGPSLDFQLSGKEKYHKMDGSTVDQKMIFSFGDYGHYAASLLLHFGYEMKSGFWIAGQYTNGLGSINNADGGPRIVHRVYGLSFGKFFGKKKTGE